MADIVVQSAAKVVRYSRHIPYWNQVRFMQECWANVYGLVGRVGA